MATDMGDSRRIIVASEPWCPYACNPATDGREGYMVDMIRAVFEPLGYVVDYRLVNFQVMRRMAEDGSATIIPGVAADLDGLLRLPEEPQGNSANAVATITSFRWAGPPSFDGRVLAVTRDYNYGGAIQHYIDDNRDQPERIQVLSGYGYSQVVQGLRLVMGGKAHLFIDDRNVLLWHLRRLNLADRIQVVSLEDEADLFAGISRQDPRAEALTRQLAEGTRALRGGGRLAAILADYGLTDWAPATR